MRVGELERSRSRRRVVVWLRTRRRMLRSPRSTGMSCLPRRASPRLVSSQVSPTVYRPLTTRSSLFSERVVTILVGPSEVTWRLHENLLSSTSDFFRSAFNSGFRESIEDRLSLPEDDPQAFELFVRWMYARALAQPSIASLAPSPDGTASSSTASTTTTTAASASASASASRRSPAALPAVGGAAAPTIHTYLRLYVLACKLLVEELENACVDAAGAHWRAGARRPDVRDVAYVYRHTPPGAGMRRLLRERLALGLFRGRQHNPVTAEWRDVLNETPDLGFDLVREVSGYHWISGGNAPARAGSAECAFHRHERGEACRPG